MRPKLKNVNQPEHPHFYLEIDKKVQNIICHCPGKWNSNEIVKLAIICSGDMSNNRFLYVLSINNYKMIHNHNKFEL